MELLQEIYEMHEGNVDIPGLWRAAGMAKIPRNTLLVPGAVGNALGAGERKEYHGWSRGSWNITGGGETGGGEGEPTRDTARREVVIQRVLKVLGGKYGGSVKSIRGFVGRKQE